MSNEYNLLGRVKIRTYFAGLASDGATVQATRGLTAHAARLEPILEHGQIVIYIMRHASRGLKNTLSSLK